MIASRRLLTGCIVAALGLAVTVASDAAIAQAGAAFMPRDEKPEDFPAGAGRDESFYACTACHGFKLVAQQGMTRQQWEDSVDLMTERHNMPSLEGNERKIVLDYLASTFSPRASGQGGWQNPFSGSNR